MIVGRGAAEDSKLPVSGRDIDSNVFYESRHHHGDDFSAPTGSLSVLVR
jgi:hypothetical protein